MGEIMNDDLTLLREYARPAATVRQHGGRNSEEAFATLVSRYINLVYSVAPRQVFEAQLAEEITQAVFIILAGKAGSLGDKTILSGWLCRTARYASANALTIQRRRQHREQEAHMQSQFDQSDLSRRSEAEAETWMQIAPLLDTAMGKLGRKDHDAVVLRFFQGRDFKEVGAALGASEDAAKMRVTRALEKLRKFFHQTRREFDHGRHCRDDLCPFRSSRARGAGRIRDRRRNCQRYRGNSLDFDSHERGFKTYGLDKSKNGNCCWHERFARGGDDYERAYDILRSTTVCNGMICANHFTHCRHVV